MRRAKGGSELVGMTTMAAAPVPGRGVCLSAKHVDIVSRMGVKDPSVQMAMISVVWSAFAAGFLNCMLTR